MSKSDSNGPGNWQAAEIERLIQERDRWRGFAFSLQLQLNQISVLYFQQRLDALEARVGKDPPHPRDC